MKILSKIIRFFQSFIDFESKPCISAISLFLFIIVIFPYHSLAIGNIHFGSLEFHPFLNASSGYANNPYLTHERDPNGRDSSVYTSYSPGLSCDWNKNNHRIQLSYFYEFLNYNNENIDDKELFDLDSKLDFRFGKSGNTIDLYGGYRYRKTFDPLTSEQQAHNRKEMSTKFAAGFNFTDSFGFHFNSKLIRHRFKDAEPAKKWDRDVINLSSKASVRPFAKTDILLEYGLIISEYRDPSKASYYDSETHSILTGFEWETTAKLSGAIKAGYQQKYYNSVNSPETWRVEIDLNHTFSEFTSFQLRFENNIVDSDFRYPGLDAGFYYSNQIQFAINHKLNYKLETWLDIFYNYSNYKNISRKDEVWQFDLGLNYKFLDWIGASFKYRSRMRDTRTGDESDLDYESNQFSIGLNLTF